MTSLNRPAVPAERIWVSDMSNENKSVVLGNEYDQQLREVLLRVLRSMGATALDRSIDIAGSQEIEAFNVMLGQQSLLIEAETYIGLSISGPADLVDTVARSTLDRIKSGD
jgi:hypothetical protein